MFFRSYTTTTVRNSTIKTSKIISEHSPAHLFMASIKTNTASATFLCEKRLEAVHVVVRMLYLRLQCNFTQLGFFARHHHNSGKYRITVIAGGVKTQTIGAWF